MTTVNRSPAPSDGQHSAAGVISVVEEQLAIEIRGADAGGYRITKHVHLDQKLIDEVLSNESVEIERRVVGRTLDGLDVPEARYEGDTLIIPVIEEVLVTTKRLVLLEEVRIHRVRRTHRSMQEVTLRKEEIVVDRLAPEA